jgi:putative oxidoreductase
VRESSTATMTGRLPRLDSVYETLGPALHAALRIGAALLFMQHGAQKLFGWLGGTDGAGATVPLVSQLGLAGVLELFGGLLLLMGLLTRPMALILFLEMLAAYAIAHLPQGGAPVQNGGELALMYALVFAFMVGNGAGPLSVDNWLAERRTKGARTNTPAPREVRQEAPSREASPRRRDTAA